MHVTFIVPQIGMPTNKKYLKSWQMEPLAIAILAGLTPKDIQVSFFDERIEPIELNNKTDLVAITCETYNAKRAYEISRMYHTRGIPVVLGGYHPTLLPEEAMQYASTIVVGPAEDCWEKVLEDARKGELKRVYARDKSLPMRFGIPDRSIFKKKSYFGIHCVETSRGCPLSCDYCSITAVNGGNFWRKPVDQLIEEIKNLRTKNVFFIDDNFIGNIRTAKEVLKALIPLNIRWFSQATINVVRDKEILRLLEKSGCVGLLIGFESTNPNTLMEMDKPVNIKAGSYGDVIERLHRKGISIYGAFIVGYDNDQEGDFDSAVDLAIKNRLFMSAFNHLVPFPGTKLYNKLEKEGRLYYPKWWLDPAFRFGDAPFEPQNFTPAQLKEISLEARQRFYEIGSIWRRLYNWRVYRKRPKMLYPYLLMNFLLKNEVTKRQGFPLGKHNTYPQPLFK